MSAVFAVFRRELAAYFNQPVAYIVITAFLLISGWFFTSNLFLVGQAELRGFFGVVPVILVFFAPAVTMRLLAEEWRNGTMELLMTLPLRDADVVLGKFLAALTLFVVALLLTLIYPISVGLLGHPDVGQVASGYIGALLLGGAFLAIGLLASALTANQVVAFIVSFTICFALFMVGKSLPFVPGYLVSLVEFAGVDIHFANMVKGVIDTRDVIYFLSLIALGLAGAAHALEGRKWGR